MFIVKMVSITHPNFEFKSSVKSEEEAINNAYLTLNGLGNLGNVYKVKEVIFIDI